MNSFLDIHLGTDLSNEDFVGRARFLVPRGGASALASVFVLAERHHAVWSTEQGGELLVEMLEAMLDAIEVDGIAPVLDAFAACPAHLAETLYATLLQAFGGSVDLADLGDAVVLCFAVLTGAAGRIDEVAPLLAGAGNGRAEQTFGISATAIAARYAPIAASEEKFLPKLIIWDLDDTLWNGTLAEGDVPDLIERRAEFVRAFNRHGVVSAICSKNDAAAAQRVLEQMELWDEFVFPRIAFVPKGEVIKRLIDDMQLRPANVLFVDDNPHNLEEVAYAVPGISVVDARTSQCDALLQQLLDGQAHVTKSRVADYRALEAKVAARRTAGASDDDFLIQSRIEAAIVDRMDNLDFAERIEELINRSNQLNYTQSRVEQGAVRHRILDIDHYEVLSVFAWDRYGYYGLVGAVIYAFRTKTIEHFAFSCRIMHMGLESQLLDAMAARGHPLPLNQFKKPLPSQTAAAITARSFVEPDVRQRILDAEAPRDWSNIDLRIMADCQSGAFHHYSRHRERADFDNNPRLFSLPQLLTGAAAEQHFPRQLVYTAATDYIDWRWLAMTPEVDVAIFRQAAEKFIEMLVAGDHHCLMFLPPQTGPLEMFELHAGCVPPRSRALHPVLNQIWRELAAPHRDRLTMIELADVLDDDDMVHAHHYRPSALQRIAGMIDDWFDRQTMVKGTTHRLAA